jgi:hypothetical protein
MGMTVVLVQNLPPGAPVTVGFALHRNRLLEWGSTLIGRRGAPFDSPGGCAWWHRATWLWGGNLAQAPRLADLVFVLKDGRVTPVR